MNLASRLITGIVAIILGLFLFILGFFTVFVTWVYAIPILIIGILILFNNNEDKIEQRRDKIKRR